MLVSVADEVVEGGAAVAVLQAEVQQVTLGGRLAGQQPPHRVAAVLLADPHQGGTTLHNTSTVHQMMH